MTLGEKITYLREKIPLYTKTQFAIDLKFTFPTMTRYLPLSHFGTIKVLEQSI